MPPRPPILVLGSSGMLARSLVRALEADREFSPLAPDERECDITLLASLREVFNGVRPSAVVNCAAFTDVDGCEKDPDLARSVNAQGAMNVATACKEAGIALVHVSTDFVFDGKGKAPYREDDPPNPLSVYGATKLEGERLVGAHAGRHLIVRTAWTFGPGRSNFVSKILERAERDGSLRVVTDQTGSPTYTFDLARGILDLIRLDASGTFHIVNAGSCSRHEFARAIVEEAGLGGVTVEPIRTSVPPGVAPRPAMSILDTGAFRRATGRNLRPWREALAEHLGTRDGAEK